MGGPALRSPGIDGVRVRDLGPEDAGVVARILASSFPEKLGPPSRRGVDYTARLILETGVLHLMPFPGNLVAELEGRVVGTMALSWRGQGRPTHRPTGDGRPATGWWDRRRVGVRQAILRNRPAEGEAYVEWIAVDEDARGKGVGRALLERGVEMALAEGLSRYTLYVSATNGDAIRLYQRLGFRKERVVRSRTTRWLFGIGEWHVMVKRL